jgi:biopolymer transport protein ExbB
MKKPALLLLILALFAESSFADRRRDQQKEEEEIARLQAELKMMQDQYDKVRVNRWQDKRNAVAKKEAFQEIWESSKRDVEKLQSTKSQKDEALVRLEQQATESQKSTDELKSRMKDFGITISGKGAEFEKMMKSAWPAQTEALISQASIMQKDLEKSSFNVDAQVFDQYFSAQIKALELAESRSINRQEFPIRGTGRTADGKPLNPANKGPALVAGHLLELGGITRSFWSTETPDVALLVKTGRIDESAWDYIEALLPDQREVMKKSLSQINSNDTSKPFLLPLDVQMKKGIGEGFTSFNEHAWYVEILDEWKHAGFVVYGFAVVTLLAIFILLDKIFVFYFRGAISKSVVKQICNLAKEGDFAAADLLAKKQQCASGKVLRSVLKNVSEGRETAEYQAYETILHETPRLERGVFTLSILAAVAPLIGLLGTVSGMVTLFASITLHGTGDPRIMSEGISEALLATKWALIIAIPCLFAYNWAHNKSNKILSNMEKHTARLLNAIWIKES